MSSRDYRHREPKKAKKGAKKTLSTVVPPPTAAVVDVVSKKGKGPASPEQ